MKRLVFNKKRFQKRNKHFDHVATVSNINLESKIFKSKKKT